MIKLDPTKIYYLSHPCTSVGMMAENKNHEQECADDILGAQEGVAYRSRPWKNKIKLIRPLTLIPECMPRDCQEKAHIASSSALVKITLTQSGAGKDTTTSTTTGTTPR